MYMIVEKHHKKWRTLQWVRMWGILCDNSIKEFNTRFWRRKDANFYAKNHTEITGKKTKVIKI